MKILIKVTKEVLERSKMCGIDTTFSVDSCAISVAVRDIFPSAHVVRYIDTFGSETKPYEVIHLPNAALNFIDEFDDKSPEERVNMQPVSFEVDIPDSVVEKIGIEQAYKILESSPTLELVKPQQP